MNYSVFLGAFKESSVFRKTHTTLMNIELYEFFIKSKIGALRTPIKIIYIFCNLFEFKTYKLIKKYHEKDFSLFVFKF